MSCAACCSATPLVWASPQWLEIDLHDGTGRTYTVTEDTPLQHGVRPEPPLRRWAARQALHRRPERLAELLSTAERFQPRHRDAAIHGLARRRPRARRTGKANSGRSRAPRGAGKRADRRTRASLRTGRPRTRAPSRGRGRKRTGAEMSTASRRARPEPVRDVMSSPRPKPSTELLDAMIEEATVDACNDEEQITGLFTMDRGSTSRSRSTPGCSGSPSLRRRST